MSDLACSWDMSVLELAALVGVHRGPRVTGTVALGDRLAGWFECRVPVADLDQAVGRLAAWGFVTAAEPGLVATRAGRAAARPLLTGLIGMLDQGTRLLDVALLMTVLRLAKGELDDDDQ